MTDVTAQMVKELRERTGAGIKECRDTLVQTAGNMQQAIEVLREKGLKVSEKVQGREASEGRLEVYMHTGNRMAALIELSCETDFVARTDDFISLAREIAMQVAAMNPRYIRVEDVPEGSVPSDTKPEKYYEETVLLAQPYVKEPSQTIEDRIKATVAKVRENIVVRRIQRWEIGS